MSTQANECDRCSADDYGNVYLCPPHAAAPRMLDEIRALVMRLDTAKDAGNASVAIAVDGLLATHARAILRDLEVAK